MNDGVESTGSVGVSHGAFIDPSKVMLTGVDDGVDVSPEPSLFELLFWCLSLDVDDDMSTVS